MSARKPPFILDFDPLLHLPYRHLASYLKAFPAPELRPGKTYPFYLSPQTVRVAQILHHSDNSAVYLGVCEDSLELAIKFTRSYDDILAEAAVYDSLTAIQGTLIPRLYGVLYSRGTRGNPVLCLVLERFGDRVAGEFKDMEPREKYVYCLVSHEFEYSHIIGQGENPQSSRRCPPRRS